MHFDFYSWVSQSGFGLVHFLDVLGVFLQGRELEEMGQEGVRRDHQHVYQKSLWYDIRG